MLAIDEIMILHWCSVHMYRFHIKSWPGRAKEPSPTIVRWVFALKFAQVCSGDRAVV